MMMHRATIIAMICCLVAGGGARAQPFDYPAARLATTWANTDAALPHHVVYTDGSVARAALLRLNPAGLGPSYAFGFFCAANSPRGDGTAAPCTEFLLGVAVVYCNSGAGMTFVTAGVPQVVWSANRGSPVREGATTELTPEGDLVLRSGPGGAVLWSTGTKGRSVAGARIGSDGNLVLFDGRNATVWQSFDHPTNALLVGQSLKHGARLTANVSAADWRDSRLYLAVDDDGLNAYVNAAPPQRYYHLRLSETSPGAYATYTNGSLTVSARPGAPPLAAIELPTFGAGTVQYMRLEHDGHLRIYEWRSGWAPVYDVLRLFPDGGCAFPTACGAYGVCTDDTQCSCPDAANFRPVDFRTPNRGCVPTPPPPTSCRPSRRPRTQHRLVSLPGTTYFNDHTTSMRAVERVSEEACKKACLDDCACAAAQFYYGPDAGDGSCYLQSEVFSMQTVQPEVVHYNSTMHIKVQAKPARN
ncbi:epidermis-specific secreted glycoprotein EP1-like [Triticum dicoccoides]|uniref:epidermis-specific secreted glycoprotein EP1-like n=1 Tax=Triticum dicoccoides TaxID=85692 RepID=UPI001890A558|nr:epidermis-specific secreted glycoprotein EP1-like [Triticum dicoccoides]